jgi:hypothetical protein
MLIKTSYDFPPVPSNLFDWSAYVDDWSEASPVGHGATEREAVQTLFQTLDEDQLARLAAAALDGRLTFRRVR